MADIKKVAKEISILVPKLVRGLKREFAPTEEITSPQIIILMSIYEEKQASVGKLAEQMQVSGPTVTGLVDRLVDSNFVIRQRDKNDRRRVVVTLTEKGQNTVRKFQRGIQRRWEEILKHFTPEERESYLKIVRKIISIVS